MLVFLSNRDKHLTFWLFLLFPLPRIVFHHAKFDNACIWFQILCFWACSWHFLSAHFHVFPRWCLWQIEINISLFELFHKILDYEFLRYYSMCYTVRVSHVLYCSWFSFLWSRGRKMLLIIENSQVSFVKHPYENRAPLQQDLRN